MWAFLPTDWALWWLEQERALQWYGMGQSLGAWIDSTATRWYEDLVVSSGLREAMFGWAHNAHAAGPRQVSQGVARGMSSLESWWQSRIVVFLLLAMVGMKRVALLAAWAPFFMWGLAMAVVDGMCVWRRRQWTFDYQSPLVHRIGRMLAGLGAVLILLVVWAPWPIGPWVVPGFGALSIVGVYVMTRSAQKRL